MSQVSNIIYLVAKSPLLESLSLGQKSELLWEITTELNQDTYELVEENGKYAGKNLDKAKEDLLAAGHEQDSQTTEAKLQEMYDDYIRQFNESRDTTLRLLLGGLAEGVMKAAKISGIVLVERKKMILKR